MAPAGTSSVRWENIYGEVPPHPALKPYITTYYFFSSYSGDKRLAATVPLTFPSDGGAEMVINLGPPIQAVLPDQATASYGGSMLIGPLSRNIGVATSRRTSFAAVRFRPGQSGRFFGVSADELSDRVLTLDLLWKSADRRTVDGIYGAGSFAAAAALLDRIFLRRLQTDPAGDDSRITAAVGAIVAGDGRCSVDRLFGPTGLGRRQFERRFRRQTGLSPKRLCRIVRFNTVLKRLAARPKPGWADIAAACGYSDQAHLIRDCRYFTGRSPGAYLASQTPLEQAIFGTGGPMSHLFNTPSLSLR